jgi:hypothetical protein
MLGSRSSQEGGSHEAHNRFRPIVDGGVRPPDRGVRAGGHADAHPDRRPAAYAGPQPHPCALSHSSPVEISITCRCVKGGVNANTVKWLTETVIPAFEQ